MDRVADVKLASDRPVALRETDSVRGGAKSPVPM
jgi:hypothetical protein